MEEREITPRLESPKHQMNVLGLYACCTLRLLPDSGAQIRFLRLAYDRGRMNSEVKQKRRRAGNAPIGIHTDTGLILSLSCGARHLYISTFFTRRFSEFDLAPHGDEDSNSA